MIVGIVLAAERGKIFIGISIAAAHRFQNANRGMKIRINPFGLRKKCMCCINCVAVIANGCNAKKQWEQSQEIRCKPNAESKP